MPCILETFVDFAFEASVVGARGRDGSFAAYDPPKNEHENHILRRSTVPAPLSPEKVKDAVAIASRIAEKLDYVGVLGVELFVTKDSALIVNEIAPRVHNSGHWTIEACVVSQFEQHIRAVAGWPLGDPARHSDAVMENIIGEEAINGWRSPQQKGGLHIYGKRVARPGRKMGHITRLSPLGSIETLDARADCRRFRKCRADRGALPPTRAPAPRNFSICITSSMRCSRNAQVSAWPSLESESQWISVAP